MQTIAIDEIASPAAPDLAVPPSDLLGTRENVSGVARYQRVARYRRLAVLGARLYVAGRGASASDDEATSTQPETCKRRRATHSSPKRWTAARPALRRTRAEDSYHGGHCVILAHIPAYRALKATTAQKSRTLVRLTRSG